MTTWEKQDRQPAATNYDLLRSERVDATRHTVNGSDRLLFNFVERPERWSLISPPTHLGSVSTGLSDGQSAVTAKVTFSNGDYGATGRVDARYTFSTPKDFTQYLEGDAVGVYMDFQFAHVNGSAWVGGAGSDGTRYYLRFETDASNYWDLHPFKYQYLRKDPSGLSFPEATWNRCWYILPLTDEQLVSGSAAQTVGSPDLTSIASIRLGIYAEYTGTRQDDPVGYLERFSNLYVSDTSFGIPARSSVYLGRGARYGYSEDSRVLTVGDNGHFQNLRDVYLHLKHGSLAPSVADPVTIRLLPGIHKWPDPKPVSSSANEQPSNAIGEEWKIDGCKFVGEEGAIIAIRPNAGENESWFDLDNVDMIWFQDLLFMPDLTATWGTSPSETHKFSLFKYEGDQAEDVWLTMRNCFFWGTGPVMRTPGHGGSQVRVDVVGNVFYYDDDDPGVREAVRAEYDRSVTDDDYGFGVTGFVITSQSSGMSSQTTDENYDIGWVIRDNTFVSRVRETMDAKNILLDLTFDMPGRVNTSEGAYGDATRTDFTPESYIVIDNNFFLTENAADPGGWTQSSGLGARDAHCIRLFGVPPPGGMTISNNTTIAIERNPDTVDVTPCYFHPASAWLTSSDDHRQAIIRDHDSYIIAPNYSGDGLDASSDPEVLYHHWRVQSFGTDALFQNCYFQTIAGGTAPLQAWHRTAAIYLYAFTSTGIGPSYQTAKATMGSGIQGNARTVAIHDGTYSAFQETASYGEPLLRSISGAGGYSHTNWLYEEADAYSEIAEFGAGWTVGTVQGRIKFTTSSGTYYLPLYDGVS